MKFQLIFVNVYRSWLIEHFATIPGEPVTMISIKEKP
jgi:hypothetical protein